MIFRQTMVNTHLWQFVRNQIDQQRIWKVVDRPLREWDHQPRLNGPFLQVQVEYSDDWVWNEQAEEKFETNNNGFQFYNTFGK